MKPTLLTSDFFVLFLLVVGAGLVYAYWHLYYLEAKQARRLTPPQKRLLWGLRIFVALLALLALARPAVTVTHTKKRLPVVAMLCDESMSMSFPDTTDNALVQANPRDQRTRYDTMQSVISKLQPQLTLTHRVKLFTFSDLLKLLKELPERSRKSDPVLPLDQIFEKAKKPTGDYTNVGDALADVMRELSEEKISGLVLLTDGRQTGGLDMERAAEQAAQAGVPVHAVAFGTEHPLRDLRIDEVVVDPEGSLGDVLIFDCKINNQIQNLLTTTITLEEEGKQVANKRVNLKRGENRVTIASIPEVEGTREFKVKVPVFPDEVNTENNESVVHVKIVKRTLRVLLIISEPSREYFYLVPALLRDPIVELSCWLQRADIDYTQQGNATIKRLPENQAEWGQYDVCILYDPDPNKLTTQQITGIETMVRKGGGLLLIAGRNHSMAKLIQVHAVKIREMLPVEIDKNLMPNYFDHFEKPFEVERTAKGKGHPIMLVASDEKQNEQIWATFPKFYWSQPIQRVKPGAIVLLQKKEETGGRLGSEGAGAVMAIQRYGEGAVFYSGLNDLWLWRFPYESFDYDRLWVRVIRYLGETKLKGTQQQVTLDTDRTTYAPGEQAMIRLRVLDPALMAQLQGLPLFASVTSPQKDEQMVPLKPDPKGEMLYMGKYSVRRTGSMVVRCRQAAPGADSEAKPLFDVKHAFQVKMQSLEFKDTSGDLEGLKKLADMTKGRYFDYRNMQEIGTLVETIPTDLQILRKSIMVEIWDGVGFLFLFLLLIGAEWSLRKWWGLL